MKAYLGLFRMRFLRGLSYRAAAIAGTATQFFWGFIIIMVLQAFARSSTGGPAPLDQRQIASYVWMQQAFLAMIVVWFRDKELVSLIVSGDSAYELCRPVDPYFFWFARLAAGRLAAALLRCVAILAVAAFLPDPYRLHAPASAAGGLFFIACLLLSLLLIVAITMFTYILCVVSLSPNAPFMFAAPVFEFASGMVIPLPFMPDALRRALEFLPFRLCVDLPLRMYSGSIPSAEGPALIVQQALWIAVLVPAGRLALGRALHSSQAVGG